MSSDSTTSLNKKEVRKHQYLFKKYWAGGCHYCDPSLVPGICQAIVENNFDRLLKMVQRGSNINVFDCYGNGPLHIAVMKNNGMMMDYLLSLSTSAIDHRNFLGETALFKAIADQRFDLAERLILAGADVNIGSKASQSPLHLAIFAPRLARLLIDAGADVDCIDAFDQTPLHNAVEFAQLEVTCMLLYYNADPNVPNRRNSTPFMIAVERKYVEIQEVLFEYVDDYDTVHCDCDLSVLGLALVNDSPFAEEMILRGADVNNVSNCNDALYLTLHYSSAKPQVLIRIFKLIWDKIDYQPVGHKSLVGGLLFLHRNVFYAVVDILIDSRDFLAVAESIMVSSGFFCFVIRCVEYGLPVEKFCEFFVKLMSYGYIPSEDDLAVIFNHWGYCEALRIALHMEIRDRDPTNLYKLPTRLVSDASLSTTDMLDNLARAIREKNFPTDSVMALSVFRILDLCVHPPLMKAYKELSKTDCVTLKIDGMPKVPSLTELARNQTREHIKKSYDVTSTRQLNTLINNLDIADIYKKLLTFELTLYRPTFTETEFYRYIKLLNMTHRRRYSTDPLINFAARNAIVVPDDAES